MHDRDRASAVALPNGIASAALPCLGWREWVALPDLGLPAIRAKVDTGARSSSLHVESSAFTQLDGAEWIEFWLRPERHVAPVFCRLPVVERREVTDSSGHRSLRPFIQTTIRLGAVEYAVELNLTSRHQMMFPMLLGRTALAGRWRVDPAQSFALGDGNAP